MTSQIQTHRIPAQRAGIKELIKFLTRAGAVWHQRRVLERLDAHQLNDIGVTRTRAGAECRRSVWDVPNHWQH